MMTWAELGRGALAIVSLRDGEAVKAVPKALLIALRCTQDALREQSALQAACTGSGVPHVLPRLLGTAQDAQCIYFRLEAVLCEGASVQLDQVLRAQIGRVHWSGAGHCATQWRVVVIPDMMALTQNKIWVSLTSRRPHTSSTRTRRDQKSCRGALWSHRQPVPKLPICQLSTPRWTSTRPRGAQVAERGRGDTYPGHSAPVLECCAGPRLCRSALRPPRSGPLRGLTV